MSLILTSVLMEGNLDRHPEGKQCKDTGEQGPRTCPGEGSEPAHALTLDFSFQTEKMKCAV